MSFGKLAALYGICTATFFAMDFIWLSTAVPRIYQPAMGVYGKRAPYLLLEKPNIPVAAAFYLVYIVGPDRARGHSGPAGRHRRRGAVARCAVRLRRLRDLRSD